MATVEEVIQCPSSLEKGCVFYATRNGFVVEYTCLSLVNGGVVAQDGCLNFMLHYKDLNYDSAFVILSRPKRGKSFWNRLIGKK